MSTDIINREQKMLQIAAAEYRLQREAIAEAVKALEALRFARPNSEFWDFDGLGGKALNHCRQILHAHPGTEMQLLKTHGHNHPD